MLLGTLEYMSPEQASGRPVDARADQFAVGLILSEMATGQPVFRRETPAQVLAAVIEREAEPLRRLRPEAPEALEAIVSRCLKKDPALRFEKTDELASQLATLAGRSRAGSLGGVPLAAAPAVISAEIVAAAPGPARSAAVYHVQADIGLHGSDGVKVKSYDEAELARQIRSGKLTGVELVRRDDEERWQPLFESSVFRREVPNAGDPREAARRRALRAVTGHFGAFFLVSAIMYAAEGQFPFWLGIWGAVLALQTLKAAPTLLPLLRRGGLEKGPAPPALPPAGPRQLPPPQGADAAPPSIAREAARVRALISERGGKDAQRLVDEVDGIVKRAAELAARQADLEEQTSEAERAALSRSEAQARESLERASRAEDRRLFERQLEVLRRREEAIAKATRVLQRLRVRSEMAEHQVKQLRLDLSRGAAVSLDVPELSSRLQFIRHEVDAKEEVEEIDAATD
jgi:hypothetical protein